MREAFGVIMAAVSLDKIDHKIIQNLLEDGRASFSKMAKDVNLTDVAIKKRVESLKRKGVIASINASINLKVLGYENPIFVQIRTELSKNKDLIKKLNRMKTKFEGKEMGEYRKVKSEFFESLRNLLR